MMAVTVSYPGVYVEEDASSTISISDMIRTFDNLATVIWGARTLDDSDDWRYVSVRRHFNSVERDIGTAMQPMVFEPNNRPTWEKVRSAITNYLYSLWKSGALVGGTEKEAYFIEIGEGITMTSDDIAQGKMIVKVGMSAVRPAEFIVLQFTQDVGQI
jgi:phage tail sheath protein FI